MNATIHALIAVTSKAFFMLRAQFALIEYGLVSNWPQERGCDLLHDPQRVDMSPHHTGGRKALSGGEWEYTMTTLFGFLATSLIKPISIGNSFQINGLMA